MPTIIVDKAKGLYQKAATTQNPAGSFSGAKSVVYPTILEGIAALTASLGDSGKTFNLGGAGGNTTVALPEMTAANIGWNCEFVVTGAMAASAVIQTVDTDGASATSDTFLLALGLSGGSATQSDTLTTATNKLTFLNGCADANDCAIVEIRYIAANKATVKGIVLT